MGVSTFADGLSRFREGESALSAAHDASHLHATPAATAAAARSARVAVRSVARADAAEAAAHCARGWRVERQLEGWGFHLGLETSATRAATAGAAAASCGEWAVIERLPPGARHSTG